MIILKLQLITIKSEIDMSELISFDYAIKYLLKDKGEYGIVEGFISALLKSVGYKEVKIIALLESESNKEDSKSKRSLADMIVEDEDKRKYIIEIERNLKDSFIHKACFNTSRLIVDNLAQREDYTEIIKVFHISLLYFRTGNGVIYHGKTIIHEIETQEKLTVHLKNKETGVVVDATDIFPEYLIISVPQFNDRLEREIDGWLYIMKHEDVPDHFQSPYMQQVREKLSILKMTPEERESYSYYQKKLFSDRDELQAAEIRGLEKGRKEGKKEGKKEGRKEGKIAVAKEMLADGASIEKIMKYTGLAKKQIEILIKS